jgi:hypothetical protein
MVTFFVAFREGCWRVHYDGNWYGSYKSRRSAEQATIALARSHGELPTRIVVEMRDGSLEVLWDPLPPETPAKRCH